MHVDGIANEVGPEADRRLAVGAKRELRRCGCVCVEEGDGSLGDTIGVVVVRRAGTVVDCARVLECLEASRFQTPLVISTYLAHDRLGHHVTVAINRGTDGGGKLGACSLGALDHL